MAHQKPWEVHPSLTEERLLIVGNIITGIRHDVVLLHSEEDGDSAWGLGCRAYDRTCSAIKKAAKKYDWLKILQPPLRLVFSIGDIPMRFYRGVPEKPNERYARISYPELEALQNAFPFADEIGEWFWRIAVETDNDGEVFRLVLFQLSDCKIIKNMWDIPIIGQRQAIREHELPLDEPVVLPSPAIKVR